jgi:hypothetical protein
MLVRLLDAFVWQNHGKLRHGPLSIPNSYCFVDRQESSQQLGFTYVQGMNVLAAPFLYTMPSELEAFLLLRKIYRRVLSTPCQTYPRGCPSWFEGLCHYYRFQTPVLMLLRFE